MIIGAARQGLALARFLCNRVSGCILNDQRTATNSVWRSNPWQTATSAGNLGGHPLSLLDEVELVCLSGGIPLSLPIVQEAIRRGMTLTNDTQVFLEYVPCPVIGITGSAGKTTTTTLVGRMAQVASIPPAQAWVGGNIGLPLIDHVDEIMPRDTVVLELSSFQLEQMTQSPEIAAILNITPNHLDRHGTMEAYIAAKARILEFQSEKDTAVLSREDPVSWSLRKQVKGHLISFGWQHPSDGSDGVYLAGDSIMLASKGKDLPLLPVKMIELRGAHNLLNVLAACAISGLQVFLHPPCRLGWMVLAEWHIGLNLSEHSVVLPGTTIQSQPPRSEPWLTFVLSRSQLSSCSVAGIKIYPGKLWPRKFTIVWIM